MLLFVSKSEIRRDKFREWLSGVDDISCIQPYNADNVSSFLRRMSPDDIAVIEYEAGQTRRYFGAAQYSPQIILKSYHSGIAAHEQILRGNVDKYWRISTSSNTSISTSIYRQGKIKYPVLSTIDPLLDIIRNKETGRVAVIIDSVNKFTPRMLFALHEIRDIGVVPDIYTSQLLSRDVRKASAPIFGGKVRIIDIGNEMTWSQIFPDYSYVYSPWYNNSEWESIALSCGALTVSDDTIPAIKEITPHSAHMRAIERYNSISKEEVRDTFIRFAYG